MNKIESFDGENRFLSNFWLTPVEFEGTLFPSVEHAFQAAKSLDPVGREWVRSAPTAGIAKKCGREVAKRADWEEIKLGVMEGLLRQKFAEPKLEARLLATGNAELIEGN